MSRLSTSIRPADSSSCSTREKYSGVIDRREAMAALLAGRVTVVDSEAGPSLARSGSMLLSR